MSTVTQHGYLVIADISGYTSFVAKTELEHSHEILSELLGLLVEKFKPLMTISKLEGDAVFAYAGEERSRAAKPCWNFWKTSMSPSVTGRSP